MRHVDVVVGNSSSGLIEAPVIGTPTVNIGDRQRGRLRAPSVIDCAESEAAIFSAVERALSDRFREIARRRQSPYGTGGASVKIKEVLKQVDLDRILLKSFNDL
jgi:UDP-N-acetylglucosamine 2-epimerase